MDIANVLFNLALSRRSAGTTTTCNALHPGVVATNIMVNAGRWMKVASPLAKWFMLSEEKGAATTLYLSTSNAAAGLNGQYLNEKQKVVMPSTLAQDPRLQESLLQHGDAAVARFA